MPKLMCGVGYNDIPYSAIEHKYTYVKWKGMIKRCYNAKFQEANPHYIGCSVSKEWLTFSKFKEWFDKQHHRVDVQLDKDIIKLDNKVYSPDTCCLVSERLNKLMIVSSRDMLAGVVKHQNKFMSQITIDGANKYLGVYTTEEEAHEVFKVAKVVQIKRWLPYVTYDMRISEGLEKHIERLENGHA